MQFIGSPIVTAAGTVPLSPAVRSGGLLFLSGQLALRDGVLHGDDIAAQTHVVIDAIEALLAEAGLSLDSVVRTGVWITRRSDFAGFNDVYAQRFGEHRPARSTVVSELALDGALVEIEATAEIAG